MLVTTAITAGRRRKEPSLSSASTTIQSPSPMRVLEPYASMMPPLITVGSSRAASSTAATRLVVVVLPCVPPIAIDQRSRISSASISARRTTGISRVRAATTSGLSRRTAVEVTTTRASRRLAASWPTITGMPAPRSRCTLAPSAMSLPCTA